MPFRPCILLFAFLTSICSASAETLSLETCRRAAREKFRTPELEAATDRVYEEKEGLIDSSFQPGMSLYGTVHYQSDSPDPASMSDLPFELVKMDRLQYHTGLMLYQTLYSGGRRKIEKEINGIDRDIEKLDNRASEYDAENTVDELFLEIILIGKEREITSIQHEALQRKLNEARDAFNQGSGFKSTVLSLEAGILDVEASLEGYDSRRKAALLMLSTLTGLTIPEDTEFLIPAVPSSREFEAPALSSVDLQSRKISFKQQLERAKALPSLNAFGTVGYGKWPLDFFSRKADFFGIIGLSLNVPISSWRDVEHKKKMLSDAAQKLAIKKEALTRRLEMEDLRYDGEIERLERLIESSSSSIGKHEELCGELEAMVNAGLVPTSEYINAVNECCSARIRMEVYSIMKLKAQLQKNRNLLK